MKLTVIAITLGLIGSSYASPSPAQAVSPPAHEIMMRSDGSFISVPQLASDGLAKRCIECKCSGFEGSCCCPNNDVRDRCCGDCPRRC